MAASGMVMLADTLKLQKRDLISGWRKSGKIR
jgi:hypothetical protein